MLKSRGELSFALGLAVLSVATAVCQFVMWGLLALPLVLVALALLAIGAIRVKGTQQQGVTLRRQIVGSTLLVVGIAVLLVVAGETSMLTYQAAKHWARPSQPAPAMREHFLVTMGWVLPAAVIGLGFWRWTVWSRNRCFCWAVAVLVVCPAALLIFVVLNSLPPFSVVN